MQISSKNTATLLTIIGFLILPWTWDKMREAGKQYKVRFYERLVACLTYLLPIFNTYVLYSGVAIHLYNRKTFLFLPIFFEPLRAPELINLTWSILLYNFFIRGKVINLSYFVRFHLTHSILLNILQGFVDQIVFDLISPRKRKLLLGKIYLPVLEPFFNDPRSPYYISSANGNALNKVFQSGTSILILGILAFYILIITEAFKEAIKGRFKCRDFFLKAIIFYIGDQRQKFTEPDPNNTRDKK